jgi:uncharacterized protein (TIGR02301 family)
MLKPKISTMPGSHAWCTLRSTFTFAPMPMLRILTALSLTLCLAVAPAAAQNGFFGLGFGPPPAQSKPATRTPAQPKTPGQPGTQQPPQAAPAMPDVAAPYDADLQRLSEILGALHFLRGICGTNEGQKWRAEAQALIDAEASAGNRHDQMIASFNRGYRGFQQSYHTCTPAAGVVIRRYLEEGAKIAREITARYAN